MSIEIIGDYRLAFVKPGEVRGNDAVSLAHIGKRGGLMTPCPWPLKLGTPTVSLAEKHRKDCYLRRGCTHFKDGPGREWDAQAARACAATGAHDCKCPEWFKWLRADLAKSRKAAAKGTKQHG